MQMTPGELLIRRLPQPVLALLQLAGNKAESCGAGLYLVGGIVRDLLLNRPNMDIDIMVEGNAIAVADALADSLQLKPVTHSRFGTATFKFDDYRLDLATCRSESYSRPGALPSIKSGSIKDDLFRRDFTVNAMALCINPGRFGELIDLYGGLRDLKQQLIRVLHAGSFTDDATRIMRSVRYEQRLGFRLEKETETQLVRDLDMLDTISGDRLRREVLLWLGEEQPWKIIRRAGALGVLGKLHPSLSWKPAMRPAFMKTARLRQPASLNLSLCLTIYHLKQEELYELLQQLNLVGTKYDRTCHQTIQLRSRLVRLEQPELTHSGIYFLLKDYSLEAIQACLLYASSRRVVHRLRLFLDELCRVKPLLNGRDLARLGVKEGPVMGRILRELLIARLNDKVKTSKAEEMLVRSLLNKPGKPGMQP